MREKLMAEISEIISTSSFCYQSFCQEDFGFHRLTLHDASGKRTKSPHSPSELQSAVCMPPILRLSIFHCQGPAQTWKCTRLNLVSQESSGNHMEFLPIMSPLGGYSRSPYDMPAAPVA